MKPFRPGGKPAWAKGFAVIVRCAAQLILFAAHRWPAAAWLLAFAPWSLSPHLKNRVVGSYRGGCLLMSGLVSL